jgi:hypothetical protein
VQETRSRGPIPMAVARGSAVDHAPPAALEILESDAMCSVTVNTTSNTKFPQFVKRYRNNLIFFGTAKIQSERSRVIRSYTKSRGNLVMMLSSSNIHP